MQVKFNEGASYITQDGNNYTLKQLHWHAPSEHTMNHKKFPLELHLVHKSEDGSISVAAILYDFGKPDPFISQVLTAWMQLKDVVTRLGADRLAELPVDRVKMKALKRRTRWLFEYMGSLTTPPCSENVTWHVFGKVRKVTYDQVALIRSPLTHEFQHNSRPTQPLNGRAVELYDQRKHNHHSKRWSHGG
ncbi:Bifunctional monodehydroascorbate reductase and carbonic anhydrase nectarin-3 [Apostasia shenzhenica]|uniref:Carbonic anhydrase n=1 Tax=Apostasia shenzhenica TaxID=1088818 RepID=A0A2I0BC73_9ASPA|nr:Bifunctional monodehydroascorbate reductase and carbonic anhydrase nectarin-3 [Apostasia shenzhenica]